MSLVLDQHPELVRRVVWVDSGPVAPGSVFAPDLPGEMPLPPFDPVPRQPVELTHEARRQVPTTLVCCSIPSAHLMELAHAGHPMFAEVATLEHLDLVDLRTGHWPMWSRPGDLAQLLAAAATNEFDRTVG